MLHWAVSRSRRRLFSELEYGPVERIGSLLGAYQAGVEESRYCAKREGILALAQEIGTMGDEEPQRRVEELEREIEMVRRDLGELRTQLVALFGGGAIRPMPSGRTRRSPDVLLASCRAAAAKARAAKCVGSGKGSLSAAAKTRLGQQVHVLQAKVDKLIGEMEGE